MKRFFGVSLFVVFVLNGLSAAEYSEGSVRLNLQENTGRFSLYARSGNSAYEPLFYDEDPRTSFISVLLNDRAYKLGDSFTFKTRPADTGKPGFVFESPQLRVTEEFSFIKTAASRETNGVAIRITVENKSPGDITAGFRFLLDTDLGEPGSAPHFIIDNRPVSSEAAISGADNAGQWVSKDSRFSLMGSMLPADGPGPDIVHFANWKRLSDVSWKAPFENGRNFNALPYSINDSAVCYYFEPRVLKSGESFSAVISLAREDSQGFTVQQPEAPPVQTALPVETVREPLPAVTNQMNADLAAVEDLLNRVDGYIASNLVTEEQLKAMEQTIERLRFKYDIEPETMR